MESRVLISTLLLLLSSLILTKIEVLEPFQATFVSGLFRKSEAKLDSQDYPEELNKWIETF